MGALCSEAVCDCEMVCVTLYNKISGVLYMYVLLQCRLVKNVCVKAVILNRYYFAYYAPN